MIDNIRILSYKLLYKMVVYFSLFKLLYNKMNVYFKEYV